MTAVLGARSLGFAGCLVRPDFGATTDVDVEGKQAFGSTTLRLEYGS